MTKDLEQDLHNIFSAIFSAKEIIKSLTINGINNESST